MSIGNIIIRLVEMRDEAEWMRMRASLWPDMTTARNRQETSAYRRSRASAVFVAERDDGRLGGFLEAAPRPHADGCESSPVGYIEGWYVDPDLRGRGLGRKLVEAAENWAINQGYCEMASDCHLGNDVSFKSHLRLGYEEADRLVHFCKRLRRG